MTSPSLIVGSLVGVGLLVTLSAFFSSSEMAIFSLPADWDGTDGDDADPRVAALRELRADPHRLLVTILVGNNVVNVAIASIVTVLMTSYLPPGPAITLATVTASFVVLVFGEIVPKSYGLGRARSWAVTVARPLHAVELAAYPLVTLFDWLTRGINQRIGGDTGLEKPYLEG